MATIKEIANASGYSPSTVSIVLGGKSKERKISEQTKIKILEVANQLGYRANIAARRLRANQGTKAMISVFMALDQRAYMMTRFLLSLHNAAAERGQAFEIVVHFYESGNLQDFAETIELTNGAIICNASDEDQVFLEKTRLSVPIVLYYRSSEKYCAVHIDMKHAGEMAADVFARRGHKQAMLVGMDAYYAGIRLCMDGFEERAKAHGMQVVRVYESHDLRGGYNGGLKAAELRPDCLFSMSSAMTVGVLRALWQEKVSVPREIELISMGTSTTDLEEHASVPLSTVHIPVETMARECLRLLVMQLDGEMERPVTVDVPVEYVARGTCGE